MPFCSVANLPRIRHWKGLCHARRQRPKAVRDRPAHSRRDRLKDGTVPLPRHVERKIHRGLSALFSLPCAPTNKSQEELEGHKKFLRERGLQLPRVSSLDKKLEDLRRLVAYELTNDEITAMVDRKNFLRRKYDPETRERLQKSIEESREAGNHIFANQLQEELDSLGKPSGLAFRTSLTPQKQSADSMQQERLAQLNAENRRRNNEAVRRAQLAERQRARDADERQRARDAEAKLAKGEAADEEEARRLRTKVGSVQGSETPAKSASKAGSGESTPAANGTPGGAQKGVLPEVAKLQEKKFAEARGVPTIRKPLMDDDIIASLDLDIDVEIE